MEPLGHIIPQSLAAAIKNEYLWAGLLSELRQWMPWVRPKRDGDREGSVLLPEQQRRGEKRDILLDEERVCWVPLTCRGLGVSGCAQHPVTCCCFCLTMLPAEHARVTLNLCCKKLLRLEKLAGFPFHTKLLGHGGTFSSRGPSRDQAGGSCSTPPPAHQSHAAPWGEVSVLLLC